MVKAYSVVGLILLAALALAGCGVRPGKALVVYERESHSPPPMMNVDQQGIYALFPGNGVAPIIDPVYLNKGDKFGFQVAEGKIVGAYVKGVDTRTIPLDGVLTTEYMWKYQGEKAR